MSQLTKLVEFLDRDDVSEVVVATGRPVTVRVGGEYRALGRTPATLAQLDALFAGSPLATLIAGGGGVVDRLRIAERECAVDIQLHGEQLMVRLTRPRSPAPAVVTSARPPASSGPVVVAAAPMPRAYTEVGGAPVPPPSSAGAARGADASSSGMFSQAGDAAAASRSDDFGGVISRSDDGGLSIPRDGGNGAPALATPVGVRKRPITMPPGGAAVAPAEVGLVDRSAVPVLGGGPASSRHSIEMPPVDASVPVQVIPTAAAIPPVRPSVAAASTQSVRATIQATPPAPVAALIAPVAASLAMAPAPAPAGQAPSRRHTITAAPSIEPLPPLLAGKARATPELLAILAGARGRNASDLHLTGDRSPMERSVRGLESAGAPLTAAEVERMLTLLLSPTQRAQLDARGYVDAALDVEGAGRVRANISRFRGGVKGSFRLVIAAPPTLEQLGLPRELARITTYHQGLVVIAGPNGHGKTTTLAALVDLINTQKAHHILTIEDPVEIVHPRKRAVVTQREVGNHTRSFAAALKASLREDPDVIVIGELRDRETVEIALTAAETGHLVMATMSTPSAAKSLDRLIDMFPPDDQQQVRLSLAAALRFVVSQRLLPTVDGTGTVAAVELLTGVLPLAALIRDNKLFQVASLQQRGRAFGMIRLDDSLIELVRAGRISEDVAIRAADNKKDLSLALRGPTPPPPGAPGRTVADAAKRGIGGIFGAGRRGE